MAHRHQQTNTRWTHPRTCRSCLDSPHTRCPNSRSGDQMMSHWSCSPLGWVIAMRSSGLSALCPWPTLVCSWFLYLADNTVVSGLHRPHLCHKILRFSMGYQSWEAALRFPTEANFARKITNASPIFRARFRATGSSVWYCLSCFWPFPSKLGQINLSAKIYWKTTHHPIYHRTVKVAYLCQQHPRPPNHAQSPEHPISPSYSLLIWIS